MDPQRALQLNATGRRERESGSLRDLTTAISCRAVLDTTSTYDEMSRARERQSPGTDLVTVPLAFQLLCRRLLRGHANEKIHSFNRNVSSTLRYFSLLLLKICWWVCHKKVTEKWYTNKKNHKSHEAWKVLKIF